MKNEGHKQSDLVRVVKKVWAWIKKEKFIIIIITILGLLWNTTNNIGPRIEGIGLRIDGISQRIDSISPRIDTTINSVNQNISELNQRIDGVYEIVIKSDKGISELNQRIDSANERIDGVYEIVIKSDKGIVEMKTGIEAGFPSIEKILSDIETEIISLQPIIPPIPTPETSPYQSP